MRTRSLLTFCLVLAAALAAGGPVRAQSLYGPGGLFLHPTAAFPEKGQFTPGLLALPQHNPDAHITRTWISGSIDFGVTSDLEVGAAVLQITGGDRDPSAGGFFKYRLLRENTVRPALAIGFTGLGFGGGDTRVGFLAARKGFNLGGGHSLAADLGVQYVDEVDGVFKQQFQPYAGLELGLTRRLSFVVEGRPRMHQEFGTPLALTLNYRVTKRWNLAITWANNGRSDTPKFGIGAGFSLGTRK